MKTSDVEMVRVYITEGEGLLTSILSYLKSEVKIRGVSVFRAISGFGTAGEHVSAFIDIALDLPLVIEFFDAPEKTKIAILHLSKIVKTEHIISFSAKAYDK